MKSFHFCLKKLSLKLNDWIYYYCPCSCFFSQFWVKPLGYEYCITHLPVFGVFECACKLYDKWPSFLEIIRHVCHLIYCCIAVICSWIVDSLTSRYRKLLIKFLHKILCFFYVNRIKMNYFMTINLPVKKTWIPKVIFKNLIEKCNIAAYNN
jgi:hypothetical protein